MPDRPYLDDPLPLDGDPAAGEGPPGPHTGPGPIRLARRLRDAGLPATWLNPWLPSKAASWKLLKWGVWPRKLTSQRPQIQAQIEGALLDAGIPADRLWERDPEAPAEGAPPSEILHTLPPIVLRARLAEAGVTQAELAAELGLGTETIGMLARHGHYPADPPPAALRLAVERALEGRGIDTAGIWSTTTDRRIKRPSRAHTPHAHHGPILEPIEELETEMLTATARAHYHLTRDPFIDEIRDPADVYLSDEHRYAAHAMLDAARRQGFCAIVGQCGAGKSVIRKWVFHELAREGRVTPIFPRFIDKTLVKTQVLYESILQDLTTEPICRTREARARQVERVLRETAETGHTACLFLEEAHDLPRATIKALKRFWELEDGFKKLLGIILIGQRELGQILDERRSYDIREVVRRCQLIHLDPLSPQAALAYLDHKLTRAGRPLAELFEQTALDALLQLLPAERRTALRLNNLITACLNEAAENADPRVDASVVADVLAGGTTHRRLAA